MLLLSSCLIKLRERVTRKIDYISGVLTYFMADAIVTDCDRHHYIVEQVPYSECEGEFEEGNELMSNFKFYVYGQVSARVLSPEISLRYFAGSETALQRC